MRRLSWAIIFSLFCILMFQIGAQAAPKSVEVAPGAANPAPVVWPSAPADPNTCTTNCGEWIPYTVQSDTLNDPRIQDPSNGGTSPQNYVNVSSGCTDKSLPSVYYAFDDANNVLFFRWRVEQIANTYATGPKAGSAGSSDPWNSALWTVLIDTDGDGFREFAVHLDGSSGSPGNPIDSLAAIYSNTPSQSIDYINDPMIFLLEQKPTAFVSGGQIANYQSSNTPVTSWPNGSSETVWDYGATRSTEILNSCNEFFIDYQIPLGFLDATSVGGPQVTTNTPIALFFSTANSLNNPTQKDAVLNGDVVFVGDPNQKLPFGDTITPGGGVISQPVVESVTAASCGNTTLTALVKDALNLDSTTSVSAVEFYQFYDTNADGQDNDSGTWTSIGAATNSGGQNWSYNWDSTNLAKGQYLIGVKATDAQGNITWSYLDENEATALGASNYANPTPAPGIVVGTFLNTCGVSPRLVKTASTAEVVAGETITFTLTVENPTADPLSLNAITDTLPAGFTFVATTGGSLSPVTSPSNGNSGDIVWTFAPQVIAANGTGTLNFTVTAPSVIGTYTNNAAMSTAQGPYDSNPLQIGVGAARLTLAKAANVISADPGDPVTYTISYANDSPVNVTNVVISDVIPLGLDNVTPLDGGVLNSGTITWHVGDLAPGTGPFSVRFAATVADPYPGGAAVPLVNTATIDSDQTDPTNAAATTGVNVPRPRLVLQKSADASIVIPGGQVIFTLSYENVGNVPATNVVLTDTLPAGFNFVAASSGSVHSSGVVTWTIGNVAALTSGFVTLTAAADSPFVDTNPAINSAVIDSTETSPISDTFSVGVTQSGGSCTIYYFHDETIPSTVLQDVAKTALPTGSLVMPTNVAPAANTEYARFYLDPALTQNLSLSSSNSVTTTLYFYKESGMTANVRVLLYKNDSTAGNLIGEGVLALGNGALGSTTVPVADEVTVNITGNHSLSSGDRLLWVVQGEKTGSAGVKELGIGYNSAAAASNSSVCASPTPALTVDKVVSKQAAAPAETLIYTITFANQGGTATGAVITDTLPTGVSFVSATLNGAPITPSGSAPEYVITVNTDDTATSGQVSGGESGVLVITATVDHPLSDVITTLTNSVDFSADGATPVDDTATTTVVRPVLTITKSVDKSLLIPGEEATYTLVVLNSGDGSATNVIISDTLPSTAYFTYVTGSTTVDSSTLADSVSGNLFTLNIGSLAAGATKTVTFKMQVANNNSVPDGMTTLSNQAAVSSDQSDSSPSPIVDVSISTNANLQISKSSTVDPALSAGDTITYTLIVTNTGTSTAQNVRISDPIVDNGSYVAGTLQFESATQTDAADGDAGQFDAVDNRILVTVGDLAPNAARTIQFRVQLDDVLAQGTTPITNTATVNAGNAAARQAQRVDNAAAAPQLTIDKSGPSSVPFPAARLTAAATAATSLSVDSSALLGVGQYVRINGQIARIVSINGTTVVVDTAITAADGADVAVSFSYAIAYANQGTATATNVVVTDTLPASTVFVTATNGGSHAAGLVTWTVGTLQPGDTGSAKVVVIPTQAGDAVNQAEIAADGVSPASDTVTTGVGGLVVRKYTTTPVIGQTLSGAQATYVVEVENTTNSAANGVIVTDTLASGFTFLSTDGISGGTLTSPTPTVGSAQPAWGTFSIDANSTLIITFTAAIGDEVGAAVYQNDVAVLSTDKPVTPFDPLRTPDEDVQVIVPNVVLSKSVDPNNVYGGEVVTYTVVAVNDGDAVATGVRISDTLPAGFSYAGVTTVSADVSGQVTRTATFDPSNGAVVANWGAWSIAPAATLSVTFQVTATAVSGVFSNTVLATSDNSLIRTITDTAPVTVTALTSADLSLSKLATPDPVTAGEVVTYTLVVTNSGPAGATGVTITDTLPVSVSFGSATAGCTENSGSVVCSVGSLTVNGTATFTIAVTVDSSASGSISNSAVAAGNEDDPNPSNNADNADVTVNPPASPVADLSLSISVDNPTPNVGDNITFTLVLTNDGPSPTSGVTVSYTLPSGYTWYTSSATLGSYDGAELWSIGAVASGEVITATIVATVQATGTYTNYVEIVAADQPDIDSTPGNNSTTEDDDDSVAVTPSPVADLSIDIAVDDNTPNVGADVVFTVVLTNDGPSAASGVTVSETLPSGYVLVGSSATVGSYNGSNLWTVGALTSGQSVTLTLTATVQATGTYTNYVEIAAADQPDIDSTPGNNSTNEDDDDDVSVTPSSAQEGVLRGRAWEDSNGDGIQSGGENGLSGVEVKLYDQGNNLIDTTTTDATGIYTFTVPTGDYHVVVTPPSGHEFSDADQGGNDNSDSDVNPTNGESPLVTIGTGNNQPIDAGIFMAAAIGDTVWFDYNGNGVIDQDEGGIGGVTVQIQSPGRARSVFTATTTAGGGYFLGPLHPGSYTVAVDLSTLPAGLKATFDLDGNGDSTATGQLVSGQDNLDFDFGFNGDPRIEAAKTATRLIDADNNNATSPGDTVRYTVVIANRGYAHATGVRFDDTPGRYTTLVGGSVTTTEGTIERGNGATDRQIAVNVGALAVGATVTITFDVRIASTVPADVVQVSNQGVVSSNEVPSTPTDDPATRTPDDPTLTPIKSDPALVLSKQVTLDTDADSNNRPSAGDTLRYTVTVKNNGGGTAQALVLTDMPDANTTLVVGSVTTAQGSVTSGNTAGDSSIAVNIGDLAGGAAIEIIYKVTINSPLPRELKVLRNQATVTGSNVSPTVSDDPVTPTGDDPTGTYISDVVALDAFKEAQLYTDADNNSQPSPGDTLIYHVTVLNMGAVTAPAVSFSDTPDANTTLVAGSVKTTQGVVVTGNGGGDSSVAVNIGDVAAQSAVIVTFRVRINAPLPDTVKEVSNQGVVSSSSTNCDTPSGACTIATDAPATRGGDDPTVTGLLQSPEMTISKRYVGPAAIKLGDILTYTIRITNTGNTILTQVPLTDSFTTDYLNFVDAVPAADVVDEPNGTARWYDLTTVFGDLLPGESFTVTTLMRASAVTPNGTAAVNEATVANVEDEFGQVLPAGQQRDQLFFGVAPSLLVSKDMVAPAKPEVGQEITYSIRITNLGNSLIVTLPLSDVYESQVLNFVRAQPAPDRQQAGVAEWLDLTDQFGVLVPGASIEVLAVFTASQAVSNTVNLAQVLGAVDAQGIATDGNANKGVEVAAPTAVTLLSFTATAQENALNVAWVTGAEINSWGFHLWRSPSERREEAVQITAQLIPAMGSATQGASYHLLDSGVTPGAEVYYWLEEIETDNSRLEYGPIRAIWATDGGEIEAMPRLYLPWITAP